LFFFLVLTKAKCPHRPPLPPIPFSLSLSLSPSPFLLDLRETGGSGSDRGMGGSGGRCGHLALVRTKKKTIIKIKKKNGQTESRQSQQNRKKKTNKK